MYVIAVGAAGVGLLALAPPVEARIIEQLDSSPV